MALPTTPSAKDEIFALFKTKWDADTPALTGAGVIRVEWPGVDNGGPPPPNSPYAAIFMRINNSRQVTFGPQGQRRYTRFGLITVQCFAPISEGNASTFAENAAIIARDAFEGIGTDSGIWFRNVKTQEIGATKTWYQFNMVAEFQFDEMK